MDKQLLTLAYGVLFPAVGRPVVPQWVKQRAEYGLGGFVLYGRGGASAAELSTLVSALRDTCGDIHIATDEEGGAVSRLGVLSDRLSSPGNYALGIVDDLAVTEDVAREIGVNLAEVGIDWDLAPAVDVAVNPYTPNGVRCFGNNRARVGEHAAAWIRGLQSTGISGCCKHFPGHGMSGTDAHLGTPVIELSREEIVASYLDPFRAAIEAGADSIMVSHDRLPRIDAVPSSISRPIIDELLRRELGYDGVVITDALEMRGLRDVAPLEQAAVLALSAGADALCLGSWSFGTDVDIAARAIVRAVNEGRLEPSRLEEANARLRSMRRSGSEAPAASRCAGAPRPSVMAAERAVQVSGQVSTGADHFLVVRLDPENSPAAGSGPSDVSTYLTRDAGVTVETVTMTERTYAGDDMARAITTDFREEYGESGQIVVVVESPHRFAWQGDVIHIFENVAPDAIVLDVGFVHQDFSGFRGWIRTHSPAGVSVSLAAGIILGVR